MVNGIEGSKEIQKGKGRERPFSHIEKNIVLNIKVGTFNRMMFSIRRLENSHKASFIKVSCSWTATMLLRMKGKSERYFWISSLVNQTWGSITNWEQ